MSDTQIGIVDAAKGLARNPLGIIALFIVLVYGFASLVTALAVFAWLVSAHSGKLFAPADFKNEENFVRSQLAASPG